MTPLRVLMVHNSYQQAGGEDSVFDAELALLRSRGHDPLIYRMHNDRVKGMGPAQLAAATVWNRRTYRELHDVMSTNQVDVCHIHNTFPLISPSAYYAARRAGVPVVQTLHNYRILCPAATFFRDGRECVECLGKSLPWPSVRHACYRGNRGATAVTAAMLFTHRLLGTWRKHIDRFVALTDFSRQQFIAGGLPAEKIVVKPNCLDADPGLGAGAGGFALFAGRLVQEKGILVLLEAWRNVAAGRQLVIAGDGPLAQDVAHAVSTTPGIEWLGTQPRERILQLMREASFLVVPSLWYEGFPMTIVEAYACGLPVIASRIGSIASVVRPQITGLLSAPHDAGALAECMTMLFAQEDVRQQMRQAARREFLANYTADKNYLALRAIYSGVCHRSAPAAEVYQEV
jgi:glycosyltransferase involved in cell wall biosynthesis